MISTKEEEEVNTNLAIWFSLNAKLGGEPRLSNGRLSDCLRVRSLWLEISTNLFTVAC